MSTCAPQPALWLPAAAAAGQVRDALADWDETFARHPLEHDLRNPWLAATQHCFTATIQAYKSHRPAYIAHYHAKYQYRALLSNSPC